jgi:NAD-dependent dihydropyrimidine dehydrogenase PreA subunit
MPAKVDQEKCEGCGDCIEQCPTDAIKLVEGKAIVSDDECIDCNACQDACVPQAVKVE